MPIAPFAGPFTETPGATGSQRTSGPGIPGPLIAPSVTRHPGGSPRHRHRHVPGSDFRALVFRFLCPPRPLLQRDPHQHGGEGAGAWRPQLGTKHVRLHTQVHRHSALLTVTVRGPLGLYYKRATKESGPEAPRDHLCPRSRASSSLRGGTWSPCGPGPRRRSQALTPVLFVLQHRPPLPAALSFPRVPLGGTDGAALHKRRFPFPLSAGRPTPARAGGKDTPGPEERGGRSGRRCGWRRTSSPHFPMRYTSLGQTLKEVYA